MRQLLKVKWKISTTTQKREGGGEERERDNGRGRRERERERAVKLAVKPTRVLRGSVFALFIQLRLVEH